MNDQSQLALLLVKELQLRDALEDVICSHEIDTVRVCANCGKLMNEGWIYNGFETFCSDLCLLEQHPNENIEELNRNANEDCSETFWTKWEG